MSVRPNGTTRLPLDGFSWNFMRFCREFVEKNSSFIENLAIITGTLHEDQNLLQFFLERQHFSQKSCREIKTHILGSVTLFRKPYRLWANVEKNMMQPDRPPMTIRRMRIACWMGIACWIPKATDTHSEYVTLISHCNNGCTNAPQCYIILRVHSLYSCHYSIF